MNHKKTGILFFAIAMGLAAATSANAGLIMSHSTPNDVPGLSCVKTLYSAPNDLSDLSNTEDLTNLTFTLNERITGAAMTFTNTRDRTKESDDRLFTNQGVNSTLAIRNILMSSRLDSLRSLSSFGGKPQNFNMVADFGKLGFWDAFDTYTEAKQDTDQGDPDSNNLSYDPKPVIDAETRLQIYHHAS